MKTERGAGIFEASLDLFETDASFSELSDTYRNDTSTEERGAVFTRQEVVDFILDLAGYTSEKPLYQFSILEPSAGDGDFLFAIVKRLFLSAKGRDKNRLKSEIKNSIVAIEVHRDTYVKVKDRLLNYLIESENLDRNFAIELTEAWLVNSDFLLLQFDRQFDFVVGNPPYVRQELIPENLLKEYRRRFITMYDRADLYIPFYERSLGLLKHDGRLGFICADRWMKNKYGGPLRNFAGKRFHLLYYIDMTDTDAFHTDVMAYPAITIFARQANGPTKIARKPPIDAIKLKSLSDKLLYKTNLDSEVKEIKLEGKGSDPWIFDFGKGTDLLRKLENSFPLIEDAGCKVGIGVATGADKAFIHPFQALDVEDDRKLPIVMTKDIVSGSVEWRGYGVINPYADDGSLVNLRSYPKLKRFLEDYKEQITGRHVAKNNPENWYRTIDRIYPSLTKKEKLLIPDIKGESHIVYDKGEFYPHHNLYYIVSESWNLKILKAILLSGMATFFVSKYSPQMRGGYLRFQAQYLRKIRVPFVHNIDDSIKTRIEAALERNDTNECSEAVFDLYDLTYAERNEIKTKS